MKRFVWLATALSICVFAQDKKPLRRLNEPQHYFSGEKFLGLSEADRMIYTAGLMDGFSTSEFFGAPEGTVRSLEICTKEMDTRQVSAIITKYVQDRPETWHVALSIQAYNAMNKACPGGLK